MATIELSSGFMAGLPARILRLGENSSTTNLASTSGLLMTGLNASGYPAGYITLMRGTAPLNLSTLTGYSARSSDVLVAFNVASAHFAPTQQNVNPAVISTIYANATVSGTATWFWWTARPSSVSFDNNNTIIHQIIGTVGTVGSGSDLEMGSVDITAGEPYRIVNLRIQFPSVWTY